jgi:hypothetical protein
MAETPDLLGERWERIELKRSVAIVKENQAAQ